MLTIFLLLALSAFVLCLASAAGKAPLWVSVLLLALLELLRLLPLGR